MATNNSSIESLFKEHTFEEIESIKDNLADEIAKRTELVKSIVKEKYLDIVETSDAIQSMKIKLEEVEDSLWKLDDIITSFCARIKSEPEESDNYSKPPVEDDRACNQISESEAIKETVKRLHRYIDEIWSSWDSNDLGETVRILSESNQFLKECQVSPGENEPVVVKSLKYTIERAKDMISNELWHKVKSAPPDQIGIIVGCDQQDLYSLTLCSSMSFLKKKMLKDLADNSFKSQIKRYQQHSHFDQTINQIVPNFTESRVPATGLIEIPKHISSELSDFLFNVCKVINVIAGFNLNRPLIINSLDMTLKTIHDTYSVLIPEIRKLDTEIMRKRAMQLYFDLLYTKMLLNNSKNIPLIEEIDPKLDILVKDYEDMLDPVEFFSISEALNLNVKNLEHSNVRLYGLLIPHLQ